MSNNFFNKFLITKVSAIILVVWTGVLGSLLYWNVKSFKQTEILLVENDARTSWQKDVLFRVWSARHGGVYVPVTKETPPNQYLDVPNRDVKIAGRDYTLVNPAYMTRQLYEMADKRLDIKGHITSLNPIRPENKADLWEQKALRAFETGIQEYKGLVEVEGKTFVRLMRPFVTKAACLRCHAKQGYKVGDIRGGISITIPLDKYKYFYDGSVKKLWLVFLGIWIVGIVMIAIMDWIIRDKINKLSRSKQHVSSILDTLDNVGFGLYIVDRDYRIRHTNTTMSKWFGIEPGQICYEAIHNRTGECAHCRINAVIGEGKTEHYNLQKFGKFFDVVDTPIILQDGTLAKMEIRTDITRYKQVEAELVQAKEAAEAAANAKLSFLANMSHDIRTPLNGIIGLLRLTLEMDLTDEQQQNLLLAKSSADFLFSLLNDVLDISKIDADQLILEEHPFLLREIIEDVTAIFTYGIKEKGLGFNVTFEQDLPEFLVGDSLRIRQVIINLLGNAIKFTEHGQISLTVKSVSIEPDNCELSIIVEDTGIGVPADIQETIFESFSQADTSTTRQYGGTGLGLAICRRLAEIMGGSVSVVSSVDQGSKFTFTAQLKIGDSGELANMKESNSAALQSGTPLEILLVEDNELNRVVARMVLEKSGHTIFEAKNGIEALQAMCEKEFDVILLDVQMPIMDGLTTARHIRACERGELPENGPYLELLQRLRAKIQGTRIPIISLTANAMSDDRQKCIDAGMDDYLTKPFQPEQVQKALAKLTGKTGAGKV